MIDIPIARGFFGRKRPEGQSARIPPGQHLVNDFPVLSAGPTPRVKTEDWTFTLKVGPRAVAEWNWAEFNALPQSKIMRDIHCVTTWSKFNTFWEGVLIDDLLGEANLEAPTAYALAHSYDGYSTNVPVADLTGKAMVATKYAGQPLTAEHGGPARLLVPHLYFWKSAKCLNALQFTERDEHVDAPSPCCDWFAGSGDAGVLSAIPRGFVVLRRTVETGGVR